MANTSYAMRTTRSFENILPILMRRILVLIKMLPSPRTREPNPLTAIVEDERDRNQRDGQERQQRTRPLQPQFVVHLRREQREPGADDVADEDDPRQRAGAVGLVRVDDVVEDREDHDVDAEAEEDGADHGHEPVHGRERRPAEPEQRQRDQEGAEAREPHAGFGHAFAVVGGDAAQVDAFLQWVEDRADQRAEQEAEEG